MARLAGVEPEVGKSGDFHSESFISTSQADFGL
jgi:hypothetical protein